MRVAIFLNGLGLGGTEKAACAWAHALANRGHHVNVITLDSGPREAELQTMGVPVDVVAHDPNALSEVLRTLAPDVIHAHVPGHPHYGDVLGEALARLPKIPVTSTNVFGQLDNSKEDAWTDFRLFVSYTSCVQAARRSFRRLDRAFFDRASVASYPLTPDDGPSREEIENFRRDLGLAADDIILGRISRPDPGKWSNLAVDAFRRAAKENSQLKLLLREPPLAVAHDLRNAADHARFLILPMTADAAQLRLTMASLDVVLHTSLIGESFGYGIAEPMNYAKPVIANSMPWHDQAQLELVRHGETGFIASTAKAMSEAILNLAGDPELRLRLGEAGRRHIRRLASPAESIDRLEAALHATASGTANERIEEDLERVHEAAANLDAQQFGHRWDEQLALRPFHYRVRLHQLRKALQRRRGAG